MPQVCWAYESQMDDIARRLGIDPLELRLKNMVHEGDVFVTGDQAGIGRDIELSQASRGGSGMEGDGGASSSRAIGKSTRARDWR